MSSLCTLFVKTGGKEKKQEQYHNDNDNDKDKDNDNDSNNTMTRLNSSHVKEHVWLFALQSIN